MVNYEGLTTRLLEPISAEVGGRDGLEPTGENGQLFDPGEQRNRKIF
jgi:hypothetical protein